MKITKSELKQIIKEEALKFKKKLQLESQLAEVEKELEEVAAGNMHELPDGTKKWKPEFEELSRDGGYPALKEEEACEEVEDGEETVEESDAVEEGENCEEQTLEEMLAEIMAEDDEACEEGDEPLDEVVLTALAGIAALVGGPAAMVVLKDKAYQAEKGKIEDKPIYKAFRKLHKGGDSLLKKAFNVKEGEMSEEVDLEKAAEVAEENPDTPEAKEVAAAMKEFEAAAKEMPAEEKAELKSEGAYCEEGEKPLNEVILTTLAGIAALVGGSVGLATLEIKAEEAAKGKIEDKPIYKAFRKLQSAATGMRNIKKGNMYEEVDLEAAAKTAEENPETPEAKEMAAGMKELEAAAKAMSDEDKSELKQEMVNESNKNSKSVLTEEKARMQQLAGLIK